MIYEGLALWMIFRSVKHLAEQLFLYTHGSCAIETLIKGEQRSAVLKAVATQLKLVCRADILDEELG